MALQRADLILMLSLCGGCRQACILCFLAGLYKQQPESYMYALSFMQIMRMPISLHRRSHLLVVREHNLRLLRGYSVLLTNLAL